MQEEAFAACRESELSSGPCRLACVWHTAYGLQYCVLLRTPYKYAYTLYSVYSDPSVRYPCTRSGAQFGLQSKYADWPLPTNELLISFELLVPPSNMKQQQVDRDPGHRWEESPCADPATQIANPCQAMPPPWIPGPGSPSPRRATLPGTLPGPIGSSSLPSSGSLVYRAQARLARLLTLFQGKKENFFFGGCVGGPGVRNRSQGIGLPGALGNGNRGLLPFFPLPRSYSFGQNRLLFLSPLPLSNKTSVAGGMDRLHQTKPAGQNYISISGPSVSLSLSLPPRPKKKN